MSTNPFAAGIIRFESDGQNIKKPKSAKVIDTPSNAALDAIPLNDLGHLASSSPKPGKYSFQYSISRSTSQDQNKTPTQLESSRPSTPLDDAISTIVPSFSFPHKNKWRVLAACLTYFGNGMNDSAPGALIPYLESWYSIGYAVVSLIFITNAVGFILAAFFADMINSRLGRSRALMLSEAFMISGYVLMACSPPFTVIVLAYLVLGFGNALNLAYNNVFCANLANATVILGASSGSYGVGGIVAPLAATAMVSRGIHWARFYTMLIGLRLLVLAFAGWSFHGYEKEETTRFAPTSQQLATNHGDTAVDMPTKMQLLGRVIKMKTTIVGALFIFLYQGAEVSESGWFISYLIQDRKGDPAKVGNVTSGFWAGITLGRFVLTYAAPKVGERLFVFCLSLAVIACQLLAWLIPSIVGDAVAVSILGLFLGPVYPCAQTIFTRLLPNNVQVIAIGFISSAGSSGGAVVPFMTGLIAQAVGPRVLHPICVACFVFMVICWAILPRPTKHKI